MKNILSPWLTKRVAIITHLSILAAITLLVAFFEYLWTYFDYHDLWIWHLAFIEFGFKLSGILFYIPIIYSAFIFRWKGMLIFWLIIVALTLPLAVFYFSSPLIILMNLFFLFIPILIVGYINLELNWRKREQKVLIEREEQRKAYINQVFQAQENERKRIAQEIHDSSIQSLVLLANNLQDIAKVGNEKEKEYLKTRTMSIKSEILRISSDLRRLTLDLRPGILDNIGLIPALRWLIENLKENSHIDISFLVSGDKFEISPENEVTIFRIIQEALNNVLKHSEATKASVTFKLVEKTLEISIFDNGKGFILYEKINSFTHIGKLGLAGIRERVDSLNGKLSIISELGEGTSIMIDLPLS